MEPTPRRGLLSNNKIKHLMLQKSTKNMNIFCDSLQHWCFQHSSRCQNQQNVNKPIVFCISILWKRDGKRDSMRLLDSCKIYVRERGREKDLNGGVDEWSLKASMWLSSIHLPFQRINFYLICLIQIHLQVGCEGWSGRRQDFTYQ